MNVGKRIRSLRKAAGLGQGELARKAGIKQSTLSDLERGDSVRPRGDTLTKLANALEVQPELLISGDDAPMTHSAHSREEAELVGLYRTLAEANRQVLLATARAMHDSQDDDRRSDGHRGRSQQQPRKPS